MFAPKRLEPTERHSRKAFGTDLLKAIRSQEAREHAPDSGRQAEASEDTATKAFSSHCLTRPQ